MILSSVYLPRECNWWFHLIVASRQHEKSLTWWWTLLNQGISITIYGHHVRKDSKDNHKYAQDLVLLRCYAIPIPGTWKTAAKSVNGWPYTYWKEKRLGRREKKTYGKTKINSMHDLSKILNSWILNYKWIRGEPVTPSCLLINNCANNAKPQNYNTKNSALSYEGLIVR